MSLPPFIFTTVDLNSTTSFSICPMNDLKNCESFTLSKEIPFASVNIDTTAKISTSNKIPCIYNTSTKISPGNYIIATEGNACILTTPSDVIGKM